jgi:hypothetical protein
MKQVILLGILFGILLTLSSCSLFKMSNNDFIKIGGIDGGHYLKIEEIKNNTYNFVILNENKEVIINDVFTPCEKCDTSKITKKYILKNANFYDNSGKLYLESRTNNICYFTSKNYILK